MHSLFRGEHMSVRAFPKIYGFTLIELLVALALLAALATVVVPLAQVQAQRQREHELRVALREIRAAIDAYKRAADEGRVPVQVGATGYPPSLRALVEGIEDARDPKRARVFFLRRIPRDPFSDELDQSEGEGWGRRSYDSTDAEPKEGDDVYDIYSRSRLVGLNGVPYRRW